MHRFIHYEAAFEDYLRSRQVPYVPVDESRRVLFSGTSVKSFDFLVYPHDRRPWIVDVKGRKFPYVSDDGSLRYWENWVTREDLIGLAEWERVFSAEFESRFIFAYLLSGRPERWPTTEPYVFEGESYAFFTVTRAEYESACRTRSPRWATVTLPHRRFRELIRPLDQAGLAAITAA
jgi:hypothetical protein